MKTSVVFILWIISLFAVIECDWVKVWGDEFDNAENTLAKWKHINDCGGPNGFGNFELQCYRAKNAQVENGKLVIEAKIEDAKDDNGRNFKAYTSAKLRSNFSSTFGKFEINAKLPKGQHLWPAFWMLAVNFSRGWPTSGEIDIMEYRGQRPKQLSGNIHYGRPGQPASRGLNNKEFTMDFSENFHTFGVQWDAKAVQWSVDDVVYHTRSISENLWPGFYTRNGEPFDQPFYLILNLAVGGNFFRPSKTEDYGTFNTAQAQKWEKPTLEIDWVRVYNWQ